MGKRRRGTRRQRRKGSRRSTAAQSRETAGRVRQRRSGHRAWGWRKPQPAKRKGRAEIHVFLNKYLHGRKEIELCLY